MSLTAQSNHLQFTNTKFDTFICSHLPGLLCFFGCWLVNAPMAPPWVIATWFSGFSEARSFLAETEPKP